MADKNPLFAAKPTDSKDVAWGLTTADTCWKRGERTEALKWLRRAVEAASEAEDDERALELAKIAADLTTQIGSMAPPPETTPVAPSAAPPPDRPVAEAAPVPRAAAPHALIAPKPGATKAPIPVRPPPPKEPPKKADRKSITNETGRHRAQAAAEVTPHDRTNTELTPAHHVPARKKANSRTDKTESHRRSSRTDEIDAWPTDVLAGDQVPPSLGLDAMARAAQKAAGKPDVRSSQAVRVLVWRAPDGSVRVTAHGDAAATSGLGDAIEATVTALEPGADLVALFRE
jgi:hypothetical protein